MATSRYITLNNWSAFTINLPFSRLGIVVGDPIRVPEDADSAALEAARIAVERGLNQATARAYELAGAIDPLLPAVQVKDAPKPAFALRAYRALTRYAAPVAPLLLAWRTRIGKEEPARRAERYGEASMPRPSGFLVWFHAASVGEANAVLPVIDAIATEHPEISLLLTTGTVTSAKLARARLPKGAVHQYVPLDNQDYVRRFLKHWQPDLAVFVESESRHIGRVQVPPSMLDAMRSSRCVRVDLPLDMRVALLKDEYAHFVDDPSRLAAPLAALVPLHGKAEIEHWTETAQRGDWDTFVQTLLSRHYDPAYGRAIERNFPNFASARVVVPGGIDEEEFRTAARSLLEEEEQAR